jgi:hypothetical protein
MPALKEKKSSKKSSRKKSSMASNPPKIDTNTIRSLEIQPTTDFDVKKYVDASLQLLPKIAEKLIQRMESMGKEMEQDSSQDPFAAFGKMMQIMMEVFQSFATDFESFGIEAQQFMEWGNEHKAEIEAYLEKDPDAKAKMDEIKAKMESLNPK